MNTILIVLSLLTIAIVAIYGAKIMANQSELAQALNGISEQLTKAVAEIVAAVANSGNTTPEVDTALDRLRGISQQLDDLHVDTPAP